MLLQLFVSIYTSMSVSALRWGLMSIKYKAHLKGDVKVKRIILNFNRIIFK